MSMPRASFEKPSYGTRSVLVDTPVWSLALRRKPADLSAHERRMIEELAALIRDGRAQLVGVVRQELLSGIREEQRYRTLRDYLRAFDDPRIEIEDYEEAARIHSRCRGAGIAASSIDMLICAIASKHDWRIFTMDADFERYAKVLGMKLYSG